MKSIDLLLCDPSYNVRRQTQFNNTSHNVLGSNNMDDSSDRAKNLINPGRHTIRSMLRFSFLHGDEN